MAKHRCKCTQTYKCNNCIEEETNQPDADRLDAIGLLMDVFGLDTIEEAESMSLTIRRNVVKKMKQATGDEGVA